MNDLVKDEIMAVADAATCKLCGALCMVDGLVDFIGVIETRRPGYRVRHRGQHRLCAACFAVHSPSGVFHSLAVALAEKWPHAQDALTFLKQQHILVEPPVFQRQPDALCAVVDVRLDEQHLEKVPLNEQSPKVSLSLSYTFVAEGPSRNAINVMKFVD